MKLFTKYNRINITVTVIIFLLAGLIFYFILSFIIINQLDDTLRSEQQEIIKYAVIHRHLPEIQNTPQQQIKYDSLSAPVTGEILQSKLLFTPKKEDTDGEQVRQLVFPLRVANKIYTITVTKSREETEDLTQLIILVTLCIIALMLFINYLINRKILSRLWNPFYETIEWLKKYRISNGKPLQLSRENADEFSLLNGTLNEMTSRINKEYNSLKSFTENASHEMQTPLAVIRSKTETLLQTNELSETALHHLQAIEDSTQKLAKLHQSLLLLTKLENRQFVPNEQINFRQILDSKLEERKDIIKIKNIFFLINEEDVRLYFHHHLAEIMITNLLNNALRYTLPAGSIEITLNRNAFIISNSANHGVLDRGKIFQRFYKPETGNDGTGLGLAIVKEIGSLAGFAVSYSFYENKHVFTVNFQPDQKW